MHGPTLNKRCVTLPTVNFASKVEFWVPWVPEVFLAHGGNFRCWPKAEAARKNYKDLTETGNRARKVSGTQGIFWAILKDFKFTAVPLNRRTGVNQFFERLQRRSELPPPPPNPRPPKKSLCSAFKPCSRKVERFTIPLVLFDPKSIQKSRS